MIYGEERWTRFPEWYYNHPAQIDSTPVQKVVMEHIVRRASHTKTSWSWQGTTYFLEPGQLKTSLPKLADLAGKGVTIKHVRTALKKFVKHGFISDKRAGDGRIITIQEYWRFQRPENKTGRAPEQAEKPDRAAPQLYVTPPKHSGFTPPENKTGRGGAGVNAGPTFYNNSGFYRAKN